MHWNWNIRNMLRVREKLREEQTRFYGYYIYINITSVDQFVNQVGTLNSMHKHRLNSHRHTHNTKLYQAKIIIRI